MKKEKSIKELVQEITMTDERTSKEIYNYIDNRVKNEIVKQMDMFKEEIMEEFRENNYQQKMDIMDNEIIPNAKKSNNIYIHDINIEDFEVDTKLDKIIEENDFKLIRIAKKMRINRATLSNMIDNPNSISLVNAFKISKLFGISIEDLFSYKK